MSERTVCGCGDVYEVGTAHVCVELSTVVGHPDFDAGNYHSMLILSELKAIRELLEKMVPNSIVIGGLEDTEMHAIEVEYKPLSVGITSPGILGPDKE